MSTFLLRSEEFNMGKGGMIKKRRARGSGSITKRKDGRWVGRYTVVLPTGEHRVQSVYGRTQDEARKKLTQSTAMRDRGEVANGRGLTVEDFYRIWIDEIVENYLKATTIELYERLFKKYILPIIGKKKLASLNVGDVQKCFNLVKKHSVCQAHSVKKALSSMLDKAKKRRLIFTNPVNDIETPIIKTKAPELWDANQLKHFLEVAKDISPYYVAYAIMAIYGLRRGEVLGIRWEDIDLIGGCIHIRQQVISLNNKPQVSSLKTDSSIRDLPLNESLVKILKECPRFGGDGLILQTKNGTPIAPRNFYRDFQKVVIWAGLPRIKLHALRHMAACNMRDCNVDIKTCQSILGHATLETTLKIYQHSDMAHKKEASDKIGLLLLD